MAEAPVPGTTASPLRQAGPWIAFLCVLVALVGLCGLFATYAATIPPERALARSETLDRIAAAPDPAASIASFRPVLGTMAPILDRPGPLPERLAAAQALVNEEQRRESASLNHRLRLLIVVVTLLAAALGSGIVALGFKRAGG